MQLHRSNRVERLVDALVEIVRVPLADPFARECIVVQGRGMERWLAMQLARRLGVWANPDFPFPRRAIERLLAATLGEAPDAGSAFAPETLTWAIAAELPRRLRTPAFAEIRHYLADDADGRKRLQLAARLADLFDQYAVFRPEMVLEWERGRDPDWQAELWRALVARIGSRHLAARARACLEVLAGAAPPRAPLPPRLLLFGVSTLPPLFVRLFSALSRRIDVHLFLLAPSAEYVGDLEHPRRRRRRGGAASGQLDLFSAAADAEPGPPLLRGLGRLGIEFQDVLLDAGEPDGAEDDRFEDPGHDSVLAALQSELLTLSPPPPVRRDDSIMVHSCHSPMREVEVLHDQLLAMFDADASLSPDDVVVMAPSIDAYAPFVDAVFGASQRPRIPFRVADRNPRRVNDVYEAFAAVLDLLPGRYTASAVLDLLQFAPVRDRFDLGVEALERIRVWAADAGVRWAVDAQHRVASGQPPTAANTWRFGLDRLLLGYALPGERRRCFGDVLPYDDVEGGEARVLGQLAALCDALFGFRERLAPARLVAAWRDDLGALLAALVQATPANAYQHQAVADALAALAERADAAGFDEPIELAALRPQLDRELELRASPRGFLAGGVTFCELVPMRTIPFRVVCLVGLNDGSFPRARRPLGFDRVAQQPRPGDRNARDDDRYLFLESLLSARQRVLLTYVGQSIADNSGRPPSVIVNELLEAVQRLCAPSAGEAAGSPVVRHALQPFSRTYFDGSQPRLFSYDVGHQRGAAALGGTPHALPPFVRDALPEETSPVVDVDELVRFFDNPARGFLQRRLRLSLGDDRDQVEDREPQRLDALGSWRVGDALLDGALHGLDAAHTGALLRAGGELPFGAAGDSAVARAAPIAGGLAQAAAEARRGPRLDPLSVDLTLAGVRLAGALRERWPGGQVYVRFGKPNPKHLLRLWIRHLVLGAAGDTGSPSILLGRDKDGAVVANRLEPVRDARAQLERLLALYRQGRRLPLPLLPRASFEYVRMLTKSGDVERAVKEAERGYFRAASSPVPNDEEDEYVGQLYRAVPPFHRSFEPVADSPTFDAVARAVWEPLFQYCRDLL